MADRTEAPTPKRLREAREEGRVVRSFELNSAAILLAGTLLLQSSGRALVQALQGQMTNAVTHNLTLEITEARLREWFISDITQVAPGLGIILFALLAVGIAATVGQTGFLWAGKKIGFDFNRVNPLNGFKRLFSPRGLVEMGKSLLKLGLVGWVTYGFLSSRASELMNLAHVDVRAGVSLFVSLAFSLALRVGATYLLLAAADYAYQRWDFMRNMRMTKEEIKEEYKRSEGDPFLKNRIRSQQRRMARMRMMSNVPKASVIITNPTHLAVAIMYTPEMNAPRVVAKGAHLIAQRIVAIARENGIPVVQNIPVARAIYKTVEVDREIPADFYRAVAEILAYILHKPQPASQALTPASLD